MSSGKKAFWGVVWSVAVNFVNAVYGFVAIPILIQYFGRAEYGLINLAISVNAYMQLMDMGLNSTNVRFFSKFLAKGNYSRVNRLFQTCSAFYCAIGLLNALGLIIVLIFSQRIFNLEENQIDVFNNLLLILIASTVFNWLSSCFNQLVSATENVAWIQRRNLITKLFMVLFLSLTVFCDWSLIAYFGSFVCAPLLTLPLVILKIKKELPEISFTPKFEWSVFKEILPYSLAIFSFSFFQFSFFNLRTIFLGIRSSVETVADYGIINGIANLIFLVSSVFIGALLPASSRIIENEDSQAYYKLAYQGTKFVSIVLCFCVFGLILVSNDLISLYVGDEYLRLIPALNFLLFLLLAGHNQCISSLILGGSKVGTLSYMSAFSAIMGGGVAWFSVPSLGIWGVILATGIYYACQLTFFYCYYWPQKMKINSSDVFFKSFAPYVIVGFFSYKLVSFIPSTYSHLVNVILFGVVFLLIYGISVFFLLEKKDKKYLVGLVKKNEYK